MYWRIKRSEMGRLGVKGRRAALRKLTQRALAPGILFYDAIGDAAPIPFGWCSLGPREDFSVLRRSPLLKPVDDLPTWSLMCFFLRELHPTGPYACMGVADVYRSLGFREIARRSEHRPVMRLEL